MVNYTDKQMLVFERFADGQNLCVTGLAGSGKSTILNELRESTDGMAVLGSTGIAAVNVRGQTVHSFAALGVHNRPPVISASIIKGDPDRVSRIRKLKVLAIDEISMLNAKTLYSLSTVLKIIRGSDEPFGGVQVLFFGDFLQLPPVEGEFAFECRDWVNAKVERVVLDESFRQEDAHFCNVLNKVRLGIVDDDVRELLEQCSFDEHLEQVGHDSMEDSLEVVTHNAMADEVNERMMSRIDGEGSWYEASFRGNDQYFSQLSKNCLAPDSLWLKEGCRVMLLWNVETDIGLCNGSLGTVKELNLSSVVVDFDNGVTREIDERSWEIQGYSDGEDEGVDKSDEVNEDGDKKEQESRKKVESKVLAAKSQIPLRPAYALSVHKTQGMQFDSMVVDIANSFACGQSYVALSRAKTTNGLFIRSWDARAIKADPKVLQWYGYSLQPQLT